VIGSLTNETARLARDAYIPPTRSSNKTTPIAIMKMIENQRRYASKKMKLAPMSEARTPILVNVRETPATIAIGLYLLPTEPESTAGRIGNRHGEKIVPRPATKTKKRDGATIHKTPNF